MIDLSAKNLAAWTRLGMRKSFGGMMQMLARMDERIVVMTADLAGSARLQDFAKEFPCRFFNLGIAEQNMTGIAAGLAKEGYTVFIISFAPFVSMRAYEAVRTLIGYMGLNVKVVGMGSGLSLGFQGNTHYGLEDIALMRMIPGITVLSPADCADAARALMYLAAHEGPAYLRMTGIDGTPPVLPKDTDFSALPQLLRTGEDVLVLGTGSVTGECVRMARALKKDEISCAVCHVTMLKPLDLTTLDAEWNKYCLIVTVEEHFANGGLGGMVAEHLAAFPHHPPLLRFGIPDVFPHADTYVNLLAQCGLTAVSMRKRILTYLKAEK